MEGLRIVLAGKFEHLLAGYRIGAEIGFLADLKILEIDHEGRIASDLAWRE
jgi:hypothetical protein